MRTETPPIIRLTDYRVPDFLIDHVDLDFRLQPERTMVTSRLAMRRNPAGRPDASLVLDGDDLTLTGLAVDGAPVPAQAYNATRDSLSIDGLGDRFTLTVETEINPAANTKLMGLYRSNGVYCTQCEADGFRRISYFLDRPDVMSTWRVRMEAEKAEAPLLLSNGNPVESGEITGTGRHYAVWDDPHKKPCYLFALVAGDLDAFTGSHLTPSGRKVTLNVYVEKGKAERAAYAMDALIRSMRWDEQAFGREYDLDLFNIVAVSDFNMGAMENKGLNIFNDRYILASPETATDQDYHNIEAIVAHEYFHNWTGNRITCRDWFQLCLKEGLTVFRDQEFSSDERSRPVERIANVQTLRAAQFVEDAGPLAHPVRPQTYKEINNFYTATVYNKGSELIQMIRLLIGPEAFRAGMDLYFERHDGEAAVVEQFIQCFADVSGRDFAPFMRWYDQAGTPVVTVTSNHNPETGRYTLHFRQETRPTPGQPEKHPQVIPIRLGLIGEDGTELAPDELFVLEGETGSRSFTGLTQRPIPSLFRGFSAPVKVVIDRKEGDLLTLARHDVDPFNRWQALQDAATDLLTRSVRAIGEGKAPLDSTRLAEAVASLIAGSQQDPAFAALAIGLPTEGDLAREIATEIDPEAIGLAIDHLRRAMGRLVREPASRAYDTLSQPVPFSPDGTSAGRRALRAQLLRYIVAADPEGGARVALGQYEQANNMTDRVAALTALLPCEGPEREAALAAFEKAYGADALILDMWFALQARVPGSGSVARVRALTAHPKFTLANPNRARSLIATFANGNLRGFHAADGSGYQLVAEIIDALDARNPQIAARMATAFRTWRNLESGRREKAGSVLRTLAGKANLSRDLGDILERTLS
ncbi:aminopeptidase N [Rhabdaerophilum sp. SD176]|uniref:aminopeptidase N n=1 Tax=Rhabdaerophilum sp. SD176 TaxID=2983548 RepID=UPI0024DF5466|nr:aminopeptidase N [Rhabdaerophilum sp. SD176]